MARATVRNSTRYITAPVSTGLFTRGIKTVVPKRQAIEGPAIISAKEIHHSSYGPETVKEKLVVGSAVNAGPSEVENIVPLTAQVYHAMPKTLQKGTIFGKTVIVTG